MLKQVAQEVAESPSVERSKNATGNGSEQAALADPHLSRALDQVTSRVAFQPQLLCERCH